MDKRKSIQVDDETWEIVKRTSLAERITAGRVVAMAVRAYLGGWPKPVGVVQPTEQKGPGVVAETSRRAALVSALRQKMDEGMAAARQRAEKAAAVPLAGPEPPAKPCGSCGLVDRHQATCVRATVGTGGA